MGSGEWAVGSEIHFLAALKNLTDWSKRLGTRYRNLVANPLLQ